MVECLPNVQEVLVSVRKSRQGNKAGKQEGKKRRKEGRQAGSWEGRKVSRNDGRKEGIGIHTSIEVQPSGDRSKEEDSPLPAKERDPRSPVGSLTWSSSLKNCREIHLCCLSHSTSSTVMVAIETLRLCLLLPHLWATAP